MLGNMDKNDPPMMFTNGTPDKGVHSQLFVDKLVARAKESGASLKIARDRNELSAFMLARLGIKQAPDKAPDKAPVKAKRKLYPAHWGSPPRRQTRDYRKLPGGYGFGSSTLANWIRQNLDKDSKAKSGE